MLTHKKYDDMIDLFKEGLLLVKQATPQVEKYFLVLLFMLFWEGMRMKIQQVLNNNVVTSIVDRKMVVVIGTGIGFQKKKGDYIDKNRIQSTFYLANNHLTQELISLMESTPDMVIDIVNKIIRKTEEELNVKLNCVIYATLIDHISFAIDRYQKNITIKNVLLWDIKKLYKKEFEIGQYSVSLLNQEFGISLTEDEAAFIAIHIMNAEFNLGIDIMDVMVSIIHEVVKIIEYYFSISLEEDSLIYLRLINHLKFFAQRILSNTPYGNSKSVLLNIIKENYKEAYKCALRIKEFVSIQYRCDISEEEVVYLTIHIQRLVEINKDCHW